MKLFLWLLPAVLLAGSSPIYTLSLPDAASINALVTDRDGNAYFTGTTTAALPTTAGAFQTDFLACPSTRFTPGCQWAFAGKLSANGQLAFLTYLGGAHGSSEGVSITFDAAGNVYVGGIYWPDTIADFPVTATAYQTAVKGAGDAFLVKLNPTGTGQIYGTLLGGSNNDWPLGLAVDSGGNLCVAMRTESSDMPQQNQLHGMATSIEAAYLAKFSADGSSLLIGTYINAAGARSGAGAIAVDAAGSIYVTGGCFWTGSQTGACVPTTPGAFQSTFAGPTAMFVMKLHSDGLAAFSTLIAGSGMQASPNIAVDSGGNVVLAGNVIPAETGGTPDFPVTPGAFQTHTPKAVHGLTADSAFVLKLDPTGSSLIFSTLIGGSSADAIQHSALASDGTVVFGGYAYSPDLPVTSDAAQPCHPAADFRYANGPQASFVGRLTADGSALVYSSFVGSATANILAVDSSGGFYTLDGSGTSVTLAKYTMSGIPAGTAACVVNAVHGYESPLAPGLLATIRGNAIAGTPNESCNIEVMVSGASAPVYTASPDAITFFAPFSLAVGPSATIGIQSCAASTQIDAPTAATAPATLATGPSGLGGAAALNQDGTLNDASHPADPGSIVSLFLTGLGVFQPPTPDGAPNPGPGSLTSPVTVSVNDAAAELLYAGPAPGLLAGVYQLNVRVPRMAVSGWVNLTVNAGNALSQSGVVLNVSCAVGGTCTEIR